MTDNLQRAHAAVHHIARQLDAGKPTLNQTATLQTAITRMLDNGWSPTAITYEATRDMDGSIDPKAVATTRLHNAAERPPPPTPIRHPEATHTAPVRRSDEERAAVKEMLAQARQTIQQKASQ